MREAFAQVINNALVTGAVTVDEAVSAHGTLPARRK